MKRYISVIFRLFTNLLRTLSLYIYLRKSICVLCICVTKKTLFFEIAVEIEKIINLDQNIQRTFIKV